MIMDYAASGETYKLYSGLYDLFDPTGKMPMVGHLCIGHPESGILMSSDIL
jgi:hypothetical protein